VPKQPDFEGDGYDEDGEIIFDEWLCPCCRTRYEVDYDDYKFCPNCGQAIDWSDECDA
jgi:predicted amidophosphoribosyltransferase